MSAVNWHKIFPFLTWLAGYNSRLLRADIWAGVSIGLVLIPQSMANAQLAGLPAYCGLYAALLPTVIGGLFGSSRLMCNGMVALVGMMTAAALEPLAATGTPGYIAYAITLSFMVGLVQFGLGLLRLGFLVSFLSQPVISGFTNAAVILIALSQLAKIFGVTVEAGEYQLETFYQVIIAATQDLHWPTLLMALLTLAVIYILPRLSRRLPAVLCAVALTTFLSWLTGYEQLQEVAPAQVKSREAQSLISELAFKNGELRRVNDERQDVKRRLDKVGYDKADLRLELKFSADQLDINARQLKMEMSVARTRLRSIHFTRVQEGEQIYFVTTEMGETAGEKGAEKIPEKSPENSAGNQQQDDGWRLRVRQEGITTPLVFSRGGAVMGAVPSGLPSLVLPSFDPTVIWQLMPFALSIAFIGIASSISIAKTAARANRERVDPNQELVAQGLANLSAGFSQTAPVAGSFTSSAMNIASGGKTGLSSVFAGVITILVLLFFTPLLYHLPQAVLAAIVLSAMLNQVHMSVFRQEWLAQWYDGAVGVITFVATLASAPQLHYGLMVGVGLSLVVLVYRSMNPGVTRLGYANNSMQDATLGSENVCRHIAVLRFQKSLFYINSSVLEDHVMHLVQTTPELRHIHLLCTGINEIDASGEETLRLLVVWLRQRGVGLSFNGLNEKAYAVLLRTGVIDLVGQENIFQTMREAICEIQARVGTDCPDCPWKKLCKT